MKWDAPSPRGAGTSGDAGLVGRAGEVEQEGFAGMLAGHAPPRQEAIAALGAVLVELTGRTQRVWRGGEDAFRKSPLRSGHLFSREWRRTDNSHVHDFKKSIYRLLKINNVTLCLYFWSLSQFNAKKIIFIYRCNIPTGKRNDKKQELSL